MAENITIEEADSIMLELINMHLPIVNIDSLEFLDLIKNSLSLNLLEKKRVIDACPTLSQFQFDELKKVFLEERNKFRELAQIHPEDVTKLLKKQQEEWLNIREIYINERKKEEIQNEDEQKINDLKTKFWL